MSVIVVITTTETTAEAERIAEYLVEQHLAACVQILPPLRSIYRWQGKVEKSNENLLLIKTVSEKYAEIEAAIKSQHSYENPEIIALPVEFGSTNYLSWLREAVHS